jgi:hypothetical protein
LEPPDYLRLKYGFCLVPISIFLVVGIFVIVYVLHMLRFRSPPEDLSAAMASATGVIGTLVGTFFGHQLGAAGKERAERRADEARREGEDARQEKERERVRRTVDAALSGEQAKKLLGQLEETWSEHTG